MAINITLWHNPRCSKSHETLALLHANGTTVTLRKYLENPPTEVEIRAALTALALSPIDIIRTSDPLFKSLNLTKTSAPDTLITAMTQNPILIERPIAFSASAAAIGRPPSNVLTLL